MTMVDGDGRWEKRFLPAVEMTGRSRNDRWDVEQLRLLRCARNDNGGRGWQVGNDIWEREWWR